MILTADIGNTNISLRVFDNNQIVYSCSLACDINRLEDEYGILILSLLKNASLNKAIKSAMISSVVEPLSEIFKNSIEKYLNVEAKIINHKIKIPFEIKIDNPKELGADRIANAAAVIGEYKLPVIVIDFGTATTFDINNKNKEFIGGLIARGLMIHAKSLSSFTSKLPKIKIEAPKNAIGTNSIDAMLSGIVRGHACMIEGMIKICEKELGEKATIIATGGLSSALIKNVENQFDFIDKKTV
jgi:type III pantothenate kinase